MICSLFRENLNGFARLCIAEHDFGRRTLSGPTGGIGDYAAHVGIEVGREGFVSGPEVKDAALAPCIAASAAEDLTAFEPAYEHQRIGLRNVEAFAVHLLVFQFKCFRQSFGDGMARFHDPEAFLLTILAPLEIAACAHQRLE